MLITALSFWPSAGAQKGPPLRQAAQALTLAPLDAVAQVVQQEPVALRARLMQKGLIVPSGQPA